MLLCLLLLSRKRELLVLAGKALAQNACARGRKTRHADATNENTILLDAAGTHSNNKKIGMTYCK